MPSTDRRSEILARTPDLPKATPAATLPDSLFARFFAPLDAGILRTIEPVAGGRDFLQRFDFLFPDSPGDAEISRSHYFESLKSERRLHHVTQIAQRLASAMADPAHDPLASLPDLEDFDAHAGDGRWHEHATHDPRKPRSVREEAAGQPWAGPIPSTREPSATPSAVRPAARCRGGCATAIRSPARRLIL